MVRSWVSIVPPLVLSLGCTMPNPAFDEGLDEVAELDAGSGTLGESQGETASSAVETDPTLESSSLDTNTGTSDTNTSDTNTSDTTSDTNTTDTNTTDATTTDPGACGNGIVEMGEQCDDGNNDDDDDCTSQCTFPICGDAIMSQPEECDDGNLDNDDACTTACTLALCGDGFIFADVEQCDDGNTNDNDGCDAECKLEQRFIFATSTMHAGGQLMGLDGADTICHDRASEAGLPGEYLAWLSTNQGSPSTRFTQSTLPYVLPTNPPSMVAQNWADLIDGNLLSAISADESGLPIPVAQLCGESDRVWTGTQPNGVPHPNTCGSFTNPNGIGALGSTALPTPSWSVCNPTATCTTAARLFCVQQ